MMGNKDTLMPKKKTEVEPAVEVAEAVATPAVAAQVGLSQQDLIAALAAAISMSKPVERKTTNTRKPRTPWTPKDGSAKVKLKRKFYQHSLLVDPDMMTNAQLELMNAVRPGVFLDGHVTVTRRRDKGIDITYPIKTAAQRLRLVNQFGIRNFDELLERCIEEADNPKKYEVKDDGVEW